MGVLGDGAAIAVRLDLAPVALPAAGVRQVLDVIAHRQRQLVRHQPLVHQVQCQLVRHFPDHKPGFLIRVGALQDLPRADAFGLRFICLDIGDGTGLPAPGMVNQKLRVDAE